VSYGMLIKRDLKVGKKRCQKKSVIVSIWNVPHMFMCWTLAWFPGPQLAALFWEFVDTVVGEASLDEAGHWEHAFVGYTWSRTLPHSLFPVHHRSTASSSTRSCHHDVLPNHGPGINKAKDYELKSWTKMNPSSLRLFLSGI
jgi:hypothetical protein